MNRIRALHEDRDLRQIDVFHAAGIDRKALSNYETGKPSPCGEALIRLANFFGVSINYLMGYGARRCGYRPGEDFVRKLTHLQQRLESIKNCLGKKAL